MSRTVMRLRNTPRGSPYTIDRLDDLSEKQASKLVDTWWASGGTLGLVVLIDGKEDSRYYRAYIKQDRIPDEWPKKKGDRVANPEPELQKPPGFPTIQAPMALPPTVTSGATPRKGRQTKQCPACRRTVPSAAKATGEEGKSACPMCGLPFTCRACGLVLPESRHYEGDDDPTPSGRLANFRCMECGAPQKNKSSRQLWQMYTGRSV